MKILIVGAEYVISNLSATPVIRQWSDKTSCKIDMLVSSNQAPLSTTNPDINRLFIMISPSSYSWYGKFIFALLRYAKFLDMRKHRFNCIISLTPITRSQARVWRTLSGAKRAAYIHSYSVVEPEPGKVEDKSRLLPAVAENREAGLKLYPSVQCVTDMARRYCVPL